MNTPIKLDAAALATTKPILPHQQAAWNWLQEQLTTTEIKEFAEMFRAGPPPKKPLLQATTNPLSGFPYFSQIDPSDGGEGWRQCQTSSLAMCLAYLRVPGITDDTKYLRIVNKYGDTTDQAAHQSALKELNVRARFVTNASLSQVQAEIKAGLPVAMGVLHHGTVNNPTGGHWIACYGFDPFNFIVNDPYGELDLTSGRWLRTGGNSGRGLKYSYRNLTPRWLAEGQASGWAWFFS
jgi:hypothetical protein